LKSFIECEEKEFTEEELIIFVGVEDMFTTKAWTKNKCLKKDNGTYKRLFAEAKRHAEEVTLKGRGKERVYTLKGLKSEPTDRITGNTGNGYEETVHELILRDITLNQIVKQQERLKGYKHGLSINGWAKLIGIPKVNTTESFKQQATEYIEDCYSMKANEYFKPSEIVEKFNEAMGDTSRKLIERLLKSIEEIDLETFYIAGVSDKKSRGGVRFIAITEQQYEKMKVLRTEILEAHGSNMTEFLFNINKPHDDRMTEIFKAVRDGLEFEHGATRFHKQYKVELKDKSLTPRISEPAMIHFYRHFMQRSKRYRHSLKTYKTSTYFWRRFYLLNTSHLFNFMKASEAIDDDLYEEEKESFTSNFMDYLYDFDTLYYFPMQIKQGSFFGDMEMEALKGHNERTEKMFGKESNIEVVTEEVDGLFETQDEKAFIFHDESLDLQKPKEELVVRATSPEINLVDNLIISGVEDMSSQKVENSHLSQKDRDELNACLLEMEIAIESMRYIA